MDFSIKYNDQVEAKELFVLLEKMIAFKNDRFPAKNVFHASLRNKEKEILSLNNSISVTARNKDNSLIGYLRILTDNAYMFYIYDVMVDPDYRKLGIGSKLVEMAVNECKSKGFIKIFLTAIPGTENFYKQFNFKETLSPVLTLRGEDYL